MPVSLADIATAHASRYLQQLCKHWSHKFAVTFDERSGTVPFSEEAALTLSANGDVLSLKLDASADRLPTLEEVVAEHLKRFAFREELHIDWQPVG
ncbi:DUF2218 domain-containing protein [Phreatobacter cathodiphilus]|jgi:hypothetical protein|uniref:DUF2218 domain-containing protein n=1 Tax=Phreatobacter cathodiphilus TaxID=1868589 RepID=A0A2S0NDZ9_9HYPH|nr:DUF2218 domain-containing protein [Phreatobacter cathodiphilus]AVO46382.1 DUF2218 domain-containing protein [Phreatobacter cathodiphilus]